MRCKACDRKMDFKKKRPVTTFSGQVNSLYSDKMEEFPRKELEDLCPTCIGFLRDYNSDMNKEMNSLLPEQVVYEETLETIPEGSDLRLDIQNEMIESVYQGFSD